MLWINVIVTGNYIPIVFKVKVIQNYQQYQLYVLLENSNIVPEPINFH